MLPDRVSNYALLQTYLRPLSPPQYRKDTILNVIKAFKVKSDMSYNVRNLISVIQCGGCQ